MRSYQVKIIPIKETMQEMKHKRKSKKLSMKMDKATKEFKKIIKLAELEKKGTKVGICDKCCKTEFQSNRCESCGGHVTSYII